MHVTSTSRLSAGTARDVPLVFREPTPADASGLRSLVADSPPLDLNSTYAYLLIGLHFASTSVVTERDDTVVGFVSAYRTPADPQVLFVWQVAVAESARGLGIGRRMLQHLLVRDACAGVHSIDTTITPSNAASWRLFRALARQLDTTLSPLGAFGCADVGGADHEEERLIRIGPFRPAAADLHGGR